MSPLVLRLIAVIAALAPPAWMVYGYLRQRYRVRGVKRLLALLPALACTAGAIALLGMIAAGLFVSSVMNW